MMLGKGLALKAAGIAAAAAAALVAVVGAGYALYFGLTAVVPPWAAAALTALVFAILTPVIVAVAFRKKVEAEPEEDEPHGLAERVFDIVRTRPVLGAAAGLAAGWIFLRNPALATIVAAAMSERGARRR